MQYSFTVDYRLCIYRFIVCQEKLGIIAFLADSGSLTGWVIFQVRSAPFCL